MNSHLSSLRLALVALLASQVQLATSVPFDGQARAVDAPTVNGYSYQGCYVEPTGGRALEVVKSDDRMTLRMCAEICAASTKKTYFGVEYGKECWCGSKLSSAAVLAEKESQCSIKCAGDATTVCGGRSRINIYKAEGSGSEPLPITPLAKASVGDYDHKGCFSDGVGGRRALSSVKGDDAMTPEKCAVQCAGSKYMGLEYGRECWCGNTHDASSTLVDAQSECNMVCAGEKTAICGGRSRLNLYQLKATSIPSLTTATVTSSSTSSSAALETGRVGDYKAESCWTDDGGHGRTLSSLWASDDMTIEICAAHAATKGAKFFGVEYGRECWTGSTLNAFSAAAETKTCNIKCKGNTNQICGGRGRMNLYSLSPVILTSTSTTASTTTASPTTSAFIVSSPSTTSVEAPTASGTIDLTDATLSNSQLKEIGGRTVIIMTPPSEGEARVSLLASPPAGVKTGDLIVVDVSLQVDELSIAKRAVLTECTLTMFLGGVLIYNNKLWTTDGSYTTVTSLPTGAAGLTTLVIVQYCPEGAASVTIGGVTLEPAPPGAVTSSIGPVAQPTTVSSSVSGQGPSSEHQPQPEPSTTAQTTTEQEVRPTTLISRVSTYLSEEQWSTINPSTTPGPPPPGPPSPTQILAYSVQPWTAGACSRQMNAAGGCTLSGAPVATSGLVAMATPIPAAVQGNMNPAYEQCARICANAPNCNSWALDRGDYLNDASTPWKCRFYTGNVGEYAVSFDRDFAEIVWFSGSCYSCMIQDQAVWGSTSTVPDVPSTSSSPPVPLTSSAPPVPSSSSSAEIPPSPVFSTRIITIATTTTSSRPGAITPPPWVTIVAAPTGTLSTCDRPTSANWFTAGCTLSGAPLQTSGLVAVATGVPAAPVSGGGNNPFEPAYQSCAQACAALPFCYSWALDRGTWPADMSDWACYLYSVGARGMTGSNTGAPWVVWTDKKCYDCQKAEEETAVTTRVTTTSTTLSPSSLPATEIPSTASAPLTTSAPVYPVAPVGAYTSGVCSSQSAMNQPCAISGYPTPASASGLIAVATGVPPVPSGSFNFRVPFEMCARACAATEGCTVWAVDRGNWPSQSSDWSCLLYNFDGGIYLRSTSSGSAFSKYAWSGDVCYNCTLPEPISSPASSSATSLSSFVTSQTSSYTSSSAEPTITTAPAYSVIAAPSYKAGSCEEHPNPNGQIPCNISGWPTPTSASGLLAMATGVPKAPPADRHYVEQFEICAIACDSLEGCTVWALDRRGATEWSCLLYGFDGNEYLMNTDSAAIYDVFAWSSGECFNCQQQEQPQSVSYITPSSSTSSSYPSSTSTSTTGPSSQVPPSISTLAPTSTVTTFAAPPLTATCNPPTEPQWYTNGCTKSGYATATSGLLAVATGVAPPPAGQFNMEPAYQQCAGACAAVDGCTGYALDRGAWPANAASWTCYLYGMGIREYLDGKVYDRTQAAVVWMSLKCFDCPAPGGGEPPTVPQTSTASPPAEETWTPPTFPQTSTSSRFEEETWTVPQTSTASPPPEVTWTPPASSTMAGPLTSTSQRPQETTAPAICTRVADSADAVCNIKGFKDPEGPIAELTTPSQVDCAAACRPGNCGSFVWMPAARRCNLYAVDLWSAIGDVAVAGRPYRDYVMDEPGCWECPGVPA